MAQGAVNTAAAPGSTWTSCGKVSGTRWSASCVDELIEPLEVDDIRVERLDDQAFGAIEEVRRCGRGRQRPQVRRQLGNQRQREIASDAIDAGHDQTEQSDVAARPGRGHEPPGRTRQIEVEPAIAERLTARRETLLQPGVPHGEESVRRPPAQEVSVTRQLPVETDFHVTSPAVNRRS